MPISHSKFDDVNIDSSQVAPLRIIDEDYRLTTLPTPPSRKPLRERYVQQRNAFWVPGEVQIGQDPVDYETRLSPGQQHFVDSILAFFSSVDNIVNYNLAERFLSEVQIPEAKMFYKLQMAIEDVHAEMYSLLLETIVRDEDKRERLLNSVRTVPVIRKMALWALKWMGQDEGLLDGNAENVSASYKVPLRQSFAARLFGMACVEGIFFAGAFCGIFWLQNKGLMPGLGTSNEFISRDEWLHTLFAKTLYDYIEEDSKIDRAQMYEIAAEATDIAKEFIQYALPFNLPEMNSKLMGGYLEYTTNNLLAVFGVPPLYKDAKIQFGFMEQINLKLKGNFFETRITNYQKAGDVERDGFAVADDF